jgi:DHA1 family bicyclomycin/chloramphenicol resistance-like MFS transporter
MNRNAHPTEERKTRQKYLGDRGLIIYLAFLSAFIPLSTDIYLPALPRMTEIFNASPAS